MVTDTQALVMLDDVIALLEADVPANPASPKNQKHERKYGLLLRRYFRNLEQAFPYDELEGIYYKFVATESRFREAAPNLFDFADPADLFVFDKETGRIINPVLRAFRDWVAVNATSQHTIVYLSGIAQVTEWGKTLGGRPIYFEGPPTEQAIKYATDHCARLVTKMDIETKDRLARVISDGIKNKRGIPGLGRDIKSAFTNMTRYRSQLIARTETCDALSQAFVDRTKALGVTHKEWIVTDPCPICEENAGVVIPIDSAFPSGHDRPPAHPNCRCALAPVMKREE